ncbi:MAG: GAF domain-containing protein, partial [Dehalococcoidia bacterium]
MAKNDEPQEFKKSASPEIARRLTAPGGNADSQTKLTAILQNAVDALGGNAGIVALWDEKEMEFVEGATYGLDSRDIDRLRPLLKEPIPHPAVCSSGLDQIARIAPDLRIPASVTECAQDPIIALPLEIENRTIGLIYVLRSSPAESFSSGDQRMLSAFAAQAAISVQNARLVSQLAEERFKIESILESSPDGIMTIDPRRRILRFNAGMER